MILLGSLRLQEREATYSFLRVQPVSLRGAPFMCNSTAKIALSAW